MLCIFFGNYEADNYVHNPDAFFDNACEDRWLESPQTKQMVLDIDGSEVINPSLVISPVLGPISPDRLSGSVKTLILVANDPSHVFNISVCGDDCAPWLLWIGSQKDVLVRLGRLMHFSGEPFEIRLANTGEVVHSQKELVRAVIM